MTRFRRTRNTEVNIWPGFVDALSTVVLVFTFVIVGFLSSQIYLSRVIVDKTTSVCMLQTQLSEMQCKNDKLNKQVQNLNQLISTLQSMVDEKSNAIDKAKDDKASLTEKIDALTKQLNEVLLALSEEHKASEDYLKALDKIKKENIKLTELTKFNAYRSEFFDKLHSIVKDKQGIKIVGDRFIFQSELFFDSASADLNEQGSNQIAALARIIKEIGDKIPKNIRWILRVDGHTDSRKITGGKFNSNWELSSARAISVVKKLIELGIDPSHLVAAGFGEFQPIDNSDTPEAYAKNRRIEFKLDER